MFPSFRNITSGDKQRLPHQAAWDGLSHAGEDRLYDSNSQFARYVASGLVDPYNNKVGDWHYL